MDDLLNIVNEYIKNNQNNVIDSLDKDENSIEKDNEINHCEIHIKPTNNHESITNKEESIQIEEKTRETKGIVNLLNHGTSIDEVEKRYKLDKHCIKNLLAEQGYYYIPFLYTWLDKTEEKVIKEVVSKINNGVHIYDIIKEYVEYRKNRALASGELLAALYKAGYKYNSKTKYWERIKLEEERKKNSDLSIKDEINFLTTDVKKVVNYLNNEFSLGELAKHLYIEKSIILDALYRHGYNYIPFLYTWERDTQNEILQQIVSELNNGNVIYQITGIYTKNEKKRAEISEGLKGVLEKEGYNFNNITNLWKRNEYSEKLIENNNGVQIESIVQLLNNNVPLKIVAKEHNTDIINLRIFLRNKGYRYDVSIQKWVNSNLDKHSNNKAIFEGKRNEELSEENAGSVKEVENSIVLSIEEQKILKQIVDYWNSQTKISSIQEEKLKIEYQLTQNSIDKVNILSNTLNIKPSQIIESAIGQYVEKLINTFNKFKE
ncbi:hypothetical protein [Bacillus cereus group sp. MG6]|uniref:hypothetical protein n=1 Tax=Bacillus cereus group sp. MG6 TaxID=3040246 RepID=UPI003397026D